VSTRIKICGCTSWEDARLAADLGADAIGFILAPSPRSVDPQTAHDICRRLPPHIDRVGVFVDASPGELISLAQSIGLSRVQLHGAEPVTLARQIPMPVSRSLVGPPAPARSLANLWREARPDVHFLLDLPKDETHGSEDEAPGPLWSGWKALVDELDATVAGGLRPDNVARALEVLRPSAVDVARGVERSPGVKDPERMRGFVEAVHRFDQQGGKSR